MMKRGSPTWWLVLLMVLAPAWAVLADTPRITGIYSDMHYYEDAGDLAGMEVIIVLGPSAPGGAFWVLFQDSGGEPSTPILVQATVTGQKIEFTLPADASSLGTFRGKVTEAALVGRFSGMQGKIRLPRGRSYWQ